MRAFVPDPAQLLPEYVEVESGKNNRRPQLLAAIVEARRLGATLLIAKLDRLSRNAGFIFTLRDAGADFVCCDMPDANTLTVGLFAVLAQHERETISRRTKDALKAKKARGAKLGTPANLTDEARANGRAAMQSNSREHQANRQAARLAGLLRAQGHSLPQIGVLVTTGYCWRIGFKPLLAESIARKRPERATVRRTGPFFIISERALKARARKGSGALACAVRATWAWPKPICSTSLSPRR